MKVLIVHNYYASKGGEDVVFESECDLLKKYINVRCYSRNNSDIEGFFSKLFCFLSAPFSFFSFFKILYVLLTYKPDVVHVHNFFPIISPSVFYACRLCKIPSVLTLHNFRIVCPTSSLFYKGCIEKRSIFGKVGWGVYSRVYKNSYLASAILVFMIHLHKKVGTWTHVVDKFIALSYDSKDIFVSAGLPARKITVKPNFTQSLSDTDIVDVKSPEKYAVFVGRLVEEKGIKVLLKAWADIDFPLVILGDGPLSDLITTSNNKNIIFLGQQSKGVVASYVRNAVFSVVPSVWHEPFGLVVIESYALSTPVIGADIGGVGENVYDKKSGLKFQCGNPESLKDKVLWMINHPHETIEMGQYSYNLFLSKFSPEKNCNLLIDIYEEVIDEVVKRK